MIVGTDTTNPQDRELAVDLAYASFKGDCRTAAELDDCAVLRGRFNTRLAEVLPTDQRVMHLVLASTFEDLTNRG